MTLLTTSTSIPEPPVVLIALDIVLQLLHHAANASCKNCRVRLCLLDAEFIVYTSFGITKQKLVVPLPTATSFPWFCAQVAKLRRAPTGNMIAALAKVHDGMATWTSLPTHFRRQGLDHQGLSIFSTVFIWVGSIFAGGACAGATACAGDLRPVFR